MSEKRKLNLFNRLKRDGITVDGSQCFISEWDVVRYIDRGMFGVVYEIVKNNKKLGEQHSALKIIELDEKSIEKYRDEIAALSSVRNHPHGVSIEDFSELHLDEGDFVRRYVLIRMELLNPMPKTGMSEADVIDMALAVSEVLADCHSQKRKILHCDIKPQNILLTDNGQYKLSDFGEAKFLDRTRGESGMRGTPLYMSPEMWHLKGYDERSDLYSLGVTMYAMLNGGCVPFYSPEMGEEGKSEAIRRRLAGEKFPRIKGVRPELLRMINKLCETDPNKRYQRAILLNRDLKSFVQKKEDERIRKEKAEAESRLRAIRKADAAKKREEEKQRRENERKKREADKAAARAALLEKQNETLLLGETVSAEQREHLIQAETAPNGNASLNILKSIDKRLLGMIASSILCAAVIVSTICFFANNIIIGGQFVNIRATDVDLRNTGLTELASLSRCQQLESLDVRGNDIPTQEYENLQEELPECNILWTVDISGVKADSNAEKLDLSGKRIADLSNLRFLTELKELNMTDCGFSDEDMMKLRSSLANCSVIWDIELYGREFASISKEIDLSGADVRDTYILKENLKYFENLQTINMSDCGLDNDNLYALNQDVESVEITWEIDVLGKKFMSNTSTLSLTGTDIKSYDQLINSLKYFDKLNTVELRDRTLDVKTLDKFDKALPEVFVLCNVTLGGETFRTDVTKLELGNKGITDISVLRYCHKLEHLNLWWNNISDISPLADLVMLEYLDLSGNHNVTDLSPLKELTRITELDISYGWDPSGHYFLEYHTILSNIEPLSALTNLRVLRAWGNDISDISSLSSLSNLFFLDIGYNNIVDISPLSSLSSMSSLDISDNNIVDISSLSELTDMTSLYFHNNDVSDITPLCKLKDLVDLGFDNNSVKDISILSTLSRLGSLFIRGNHYDHSQLGELEGALPNCKIIYE